MKFEHLNYFVINVLLWYTSFYLNFFTSLFNLYSISIFFKWKLNNYAEGYWFLYSNKKSIYETRFLSRTN